MLGGERNQGQCSTRQCDWHWGSDLKAAHHLYSCGQRAVSKEICPYNIQHPPFDPGSVSWSHAIEALTARWWSCQTPGILPSGIFILTVVPNPLLPCSLHRDGTLFHHCVIYQMGELEPTQTSDNGGMAMHCQAAIKNNGYQGFTILWRNACILAYRAYPQW